MHHRRNNRHILPEGKKERQWIGTPSGGDSGAEDKPRWSFSRISGIVVGIFDNTNSFKNKDGGRL